MKNSIDNFKSFVSAGDGLARTNRYVINWAPLNSFSNRDSGIFGVESVTLPGRSITTDEIQMQKQAVKMPYTFIDDPVTVTFIMTQKYDIKRAFDDLMDKVFDSTEYRIGYKADYAQSDLSISQLDRAGSEVYTLVLKKPFPIQTQSIEFSNLSENEYSRLVVTFAYDSYKIDK